MKKTSIRMFVKFAKFLVSAAIGGFLTLLILFVIYFDSQPELNLWHKVHLDKEFTSSSKIKTFDAYRKLEQALFLQLDTKVYRHISATKKQKFNRYHKGSQSAPGRWPINWNRSFEFKAEQPGPGVLLIHGVSDSPYSLKTLGLSLRKSGVWVVGLRLPGHGTVPSGLVHMRWQDMAAAVKLAMQHLRSKIGNQPIYIVGYSTGGALAMHYVLTTLEDSKLTKAKGVIMISPSIGVSGAAVLAKWQARLGYLLGLNKLKWNSINPEFDPYKYGSFAVNAGDQVYRLTSEIQSLLSRYDKEKRKQIPPILAFQSVVDSTVSTQALVQGLFDLLPNNGHELVLFDINRLEDYSLLFKNNPTAEISRILKKSDNNFTISLLTNKNNHSRQLKVRQRKAGGTEIVEQETNMAWPMHLYSLSHVAIPIAQNDVVYGNGKGKKGNGITLGNLVLRGERGVLQISATSMLRLRWNPFYSYVEKRIHQFVK